MYFGAIHAVIVQYFKRPPLESVAFIIPAQRPHSASPVTRNKSVWIRPCIAPLVLHTQPLHEVFTHAIEFRSSHTHYCPLLTPSMLFVTPTMRTCLYHSTTYRSSVRACVYAHVLIRLYKLQYIIPRTYKTTKKTKNYF